jgi:hypothetical protein
MSPTSNVNKVEAMCSEIANSIYLRKQTPDELTELAIVLVKVNRLIKECVPTLVTEVTELRARNRQLSDQLHGTGTGQ